MFFYNSTNGPLFSGSFLWLLHGTITRLKIVININNLYHYCFRKSNKKGVDVHVKLQDILVLWDKLLY
jgi:hypothetical protein